MSRRMLREVTRYIVLSIVMLQATMCCAAICVLAFLGTGDPSLPVITAALIITRISFLGGIMLGLCALFLNLRFGKGRKR